MLASLTLAPVCDAGILTVGPAGSGAQFTQIQAAISAASDDDVILVQAGTYQRIVVEKPLRILGDGRGVVRIGGAPPCVTVRGIGAPEELVLSGVEVMNSSGIFEQVILVQDCPGTVVLQDVVLPRTFITGVQAENCARMLVLDGRINAGLAVGNGGAVFARNSELWIASSDIDGVFGEFSHDPFTTPGIELVSSRLHLWRSRIHGGGPATGSKGALPGGAGIRATGSSVDLFGGPGTTVVGGPGARALIGRSTNTSGGPGLDLRELSHARIQDDAFVQGGLDGQGLVQAPAVQVDGTSSFTLDPKVFPALASSARQVQLGSTFALSLTDNPGGYQVLYLSQRTGPTTVLRGVDGFGLLDRSTMLKVASEVLPPSATTTLDFHVPSNLALLGATLFFQAAELFPNSLGPGHPMPRNRYAIGNPALVTITR